MGYAALAVGCAAEPPRVVAQLALRGEVMISNSPMVLRPQGPRRRNGQLSFSYSFLVENSGVATAALELGEASLRVSGRAMVVPCKVAGHVYTEYLLAGQARVRVDCEISVAISAAPRNSQADAPLELSVPLELDGHREAVLLRYSLLAQDAG